MMSVQEVTEVFNHLQLQVFVPSSNSLLSQLVPEAMDNPLTWTKLSSLSFVSIQSVIEMMTLTRKKVVAQLDENVRSAISSAVEQIRIPVGTLFSSTRRFPEGLYVAWIPAHPMIQSICLLQKLCVTKLPTEPLSCAKLLTVVENVENYVAALDVKSLGVYDRDKFERQIARWKFNWQQLSYGYEIIENEPLRRS